jgi:hypothetical protein
MAEIENIFFDFKEIVTLLVKQQGIHTGIWALHVEFGLAAANMAIEIGEKPPTPSTEPPTNVLPTAIIPIRRLGIARAAHLSDLSVDAAVVNPKPKAKGRNTK